MTSARSEGMASPGLSSVAISSSRMPRTWARFVVAEGWCGDQTLLGEVSRGVVVPALPLVVGRPRDRPGHGRAPMRLLTTYGYSQLTGPEGQYAPGAWRGPRTPQRKVLTTSYPRCQRAQRSAQWYIAIAAAAPAFRDRVEPYWVIATRSLHTATSSSVNPGPSEPNTRQVCCGNS